MILIVVCGLLYFLVLGNEYKEYKYAKRKGFRYKITFERIFKMVLPPLFIIYIIIFFSWEDFVEYRKTVKEHGGYRKYKEWRKKEKRKEKRKKLRDEEKEAEKNRIKKAYENGMLRRDELPRCLDGISYFELYGNILDTNWWDLVYIENEYNEALNSFFKRHPEIKLKHKMRVVYLPRCVKELTSDDVLRYWNPCPSDKSIDFSNIGTDVLLSELCYPEDAARLEHGLISCTGWCFNLDARYIRGHYYPLEVGGDNYILQQIERIARDVFGRHSGGLYCELKDESKGKKRTSNFADEHFDYEIQNLVEEVRERVEKLEQRGVSRKLLMSLIQEKPRLSRLVVTKDMRILLPDYQNMEIKMEPINKAVYLLFLRHPKGIVFKHLPCYRKELAEIYQKIKPYGLNQRAIQSIEDVTNPLLNSINEKCARIRGAFVSMFDEELAKNYYVFGSRGEEKKISLPCDLVTWE